MKKIIAYALAAVLSLGAIITVSAADDIDPIMNEGDNNIVAAAAEYAPDTGFSGTGSASRTAMRAFMEKLVTDFEARGGTGEGSGDIMVAAAGGVVIIGTKTGEVLEDTIVFDTPVKKEHFAGWSVSGSSSSPLFKKASAEKEKNGDVTGIAIEFNTDKSTNTDDKDIKITIRFTKGTEFVNGIFEYTYSSDVRSYDEGADISVDNGAIYEYTESDTSGGATFFFNANTRFDARIARTQGPVNLTFDTGSLDVIEDEHPNVDFSFFRVMGTNNFRSEGKLVIKADEGDYLYGIEGNKLVALNNWTYNRSEGTIVLTTNRLGGYAVANQNLKLTTTGTGTTATGRNPNTGSSRAIDGAVMFALISLVATGAATLRKVTK